MKIGKKLIVLLVIITASCKVPLNEEQTQNKKSTAPNIVFLFTDDQTYQTVRALGNDVIQTPNLDRLVDSGTTFTHAYNMGGWNGAVCIASRSMITSGAFIWRAKQTEVLWTENDSTALSQTWERLLAQKGYRTFMSGKWHVKAPSKELFDIVKNERPGMPGDSWGKGRGRKVAEAIKNGEDVDAAMPIGYNRPKNESDNSWSASDPTFGGYWEGGKHWSEVLKDDALDFIQDTSTKEEPFFMYLAFNAPHDPRQAPKKFIEMYPIDSIKLPENFLTEYPWKDDIGNGRSLRDEALAPYPRTEYAVKKHMQEYYAIISHLDQQIGEILNALEATGKMDNTYIFFTSDHGLALGQHGLIGKQNLYDHSIRVPLMVVGPDIPQGKKRDQDVYLQDIMASCLELAKIDKPSYVEFNSFLDIIHDNTRESHYDAIYGCYMNHQRMIRKDGYKLIVYPEIKKILLFDLNIDPNEINNVVDKPELAGKVKNLFKDLIDLQKNMGDELDLRETYLTL